jgi:hypothetical protein
LGPPDELSRHLARARATKLPITVQEILYTDDDENVAVMVRFADGTTAGCLVPLDMLSVDNIRVSAAVTAAVWEMLKPPPVHKGRFKDDRVIDLDE